MWHLCLKMRKHGRLDGYIMYIPSTRPSFWGKMRIHQPFLSIFFLCSSIFLSFSYHFPYISRPSRVTRTNLTVCRVDDNDRFGRDDRLHFDQLIRLGSAENSCPVVWYPQIYQKSVIKSAYKIAIPNQRFIFLGLPQTFGWRNPQDSRGFAWASSLPLRKPEPQS